MVSRLERLRQQNHNHLNNQLISSPLSQFTASKTYDISQVPMTTPKDPFGLDMNYVINSLNNQPSVNLSVSNPIGAIGDGRPTVSTSTGVSDSRLRRE